jgi:hypothetical protein
LDKKTEAAIERLVADWPELTEDTKAKLRDLLSPEPPGGQEAYSQLLRKVAMSRPPLTGEQLDELAGIIRVSRAKQEDSASGPES